jgi:signal transduction histidine kinase
MQITNFTTRIPVPVKFVLGMLLILAISLVAFSLIMRPPLNEIGLMAQFLTITAIISGLVGYGSYRLGWMDRSPTIRWTLLGGYALASILTFFNVWLTATLMFASPHDLLLAMVLLIFAGGMAMALGYFLSSTLTNRIHTIDEAAQTIAAGDLEVRIPVTGRDEMADLARTFNQMAAQLQGAEQKQQELEALRRDLIAWAGHDLQTPLASVRAIIEALADGVVDDPESIQRYLRTAQINIQSLSALIDDLFQMSQLDAGGLPLDCTDNSLSDLISDTLESFSELANRQGVHLAGSVAAGIDPIYMDAQRIGRVLNNLVSNALHHTPEGGSVEVRASPSSGAVLVEVIDGGQGIRPEDLPFVFDRFYRGEKSRSRTTGGAGLGLAIARGIVEAHRGQIDVESASGRTRFYFTLPASSNSP